MKVLFIGPLPEPVTGQSLACQVLLDGLRPTHQIDVVDLNKKEFRQGISSTGRVREILKILWRVWQKHGAAEVIYLTVSESLAGNLKDLLIYVLCFNQLGTMVIHLHGGAGMSRIMGGERPMLRRLNVPFLKRLGGAIVLGQQHVSVYQGVVPDRKIHVVPNFAEDDLFTTPERIQAKFSQTTPLKVLFLSNLLPGKGHHELIDAFLALDERTRAAIQIDLAGGFESERQRQSFLGRIASEPRIRYHGTVAGERKRTLFDQAHVFCLPTYYPYEGQPISILEAYASGCAVITTDHSGIPDIFREGVNGFKVATQSVDDLRHALGRAVAEPDRLRQMATTNLETARASYRTSVYTKTLVQILDSVAGVG